MYVNCFLYFYTVNQAINIPEVSPEVALLLHEKVVPTAAILDVNSLVLSKNDLLAQQKNIIAEKQNIIAQKDSLLSQKDKAIVEKDAEIYNLQFQLTQLRRALFGSKSERFVPESVDQLRLDFDMGEEVAATPQKG